MYVTPFRSQKRASASFNSSNETNQNRPDEARKSWTTKGQKVPFCWTNWPLVGLASMAYAALVMMGSGVQSRVHSGVRVVGSWLADLKNGCTLAVKTARVG